MFVSEAAKRIENPLLQKPKWNWILSLTLSFSKVNEKLRKLFAFFVCKHWIQQLSNNSKIGASKITKTVDFYSEDFQNIF